MPNYQTACPTRHGRGLLPSRVNMSGTFALIGFLIAMIMRADRDLGKIESGKINFAHIVLMVLTVFVTSFSFKILFKLLLEYETTLSIIYVQNGFFGPVMNTTVWIVTTLLNVLVLFAVISVAQRSEKARKILVNTLPLALLANTIKAINESIAASKPETPIEFVIGVIVTGMLISFLPAFLFYRNDNVKKIIFEKSPEKRENSANP